MRRVDVTQLAKDPVGSFVAGASYAHFCLSPALWGVLLWGRPDQSDALALGRSLVLELDPGVPPHVSIVDARRLAGSDAHAFEALERYLGHFAEVLQKQVLRLALLRPKGLHGALVTGVFDVVPRPYPVAVFDDVRPAFDWLGAAPPLAASADELARTLDGLYAETTETPRFLSELRVVIEQNLRGLTLARAAKLSGVSTRTLQRRLEEAGTRFQDELASARIRAAEALLVESDQPLTAIAFDVGCASPQHFNALFRSRHGEAPSAWRRRKRQA